MSKDSLWFTDYHLDFTTYLLYCNNYLCQKVKTLKYKNTAITYFIKL